VTVVRHVIGGEEVDSLSGDRFESVNPWTREPWAEVALGSAPDVDRAVVAARRAFDEGPWPRMGTAARQAVLHRFADLLSDHAEALGLADSSDMGKPISDLLEREVPRAAHNLRFFADHAAMATGEVFPMDSGHHAYERFEPAGVVAAISPWNFPLMLETWKVAPALAWGNTVVLKPAEESPASASLLARLGLEAGLPPGVLNVVHGFGPDSAGEALTRHPAVDRVTFTGESATGRAVAAAAASHLAPVSLELGGKGASIVFADADLDNAVEWSVRAAFSNAGQVCLAGSRLFVEAAVYDEFVERLVAAAESLVLGDPAERTTQVGPLSSRQHFEKVVGYLDEIPLAGGKVLTGGRRQGWLLAPTVVTGLAADARACREEIFGPILPVLAFEDEEEAVRLANDSPFGLNAMCFTTNLSRGHRVAGRLRAGTVWVNCFFVRDLRAPFGGVGDSGVGREGGTYSREFFTEPKAVVVEIDQRPPKGPTRQKAPDAGS
jgi:aminomuconate-semialdehyde/2-hydroxymuconate-6-semialdehyde dehydrogenase